MPQSATAVPAAPPYFALRMRIFYAGFFAFTGVMLPFFPVWLKSRGLSAVEIADVIAIPAFVRVFLTPLAGIYADRAPSRRFATLTFIVPAALVFPIAWNAHDFVSLLAITGIAFTSYALALPPADALALTGVRRFNIDYGRMRLSGSAAFVVANLGAGALLSLYAGSGDIIFWSMVAALALATVGAVALPRTPAAIRALDDAARPDERPSLAVLTDPGLLVVLFACGFVMASQGMLNGFASIYWRHLGFPDLGIGILWAIGVVSEVTLFMWSRRLIDRFGPYGLLGAGVITAMARWALFPFLDNIYAFAVLQALHGITFAAAYAGTQSLIARMVPERTTASVQGVFGMITGTLLAVTTALSGPIYDSLGVWGFLWMVPVAGAGLAIMIAGRRFVPR